MSGKDIPSPDFRLTPRQPCTSATFSFVVTRAREKSALLLARLKLRAHGYDLVSGDFVPAVIAASLTLSEFPIPALREAALRVEAI